MDDPRQLALRWQEAYNGHDRERFRGVLAEDAWLTSPNGVFHGEPAISAYMMAWAAAFPDSSLTVQHVTTDGNTVVVEALFTGTHLATLAVPGGGIPATNRQVEARTAYALVVDGDVVTHVRMYFDSLDLLVTLGLIGDETPSD